MTIPISLESILIIKDSAHLITSNDTLITQRMYKILFSKYPHVKEIFKNAPEDQYMRLAEILSAYAVNIDKIDRLRPALEVIAKIHTRVNIKEAHYPMIGIVLMQAIEDILGDKANIEFMDAWREAFQLIASILISMEKKIYARKALLN